MANEMGSQTLEPTRNELEKVESSYKLTSYKAKELPEEFKNLIIGPFLNSLRYGNDLFKLIEKQSYYHSYGKYVEHLLARPNTVIKMAMLSDKTVLGWSFLENDCVHYVWVKKEMRRQGICKALLPKKFNKISHLTNKGINIWVAHYPEVEFDPFV